MSSPDTTREVDPGYVRALLLVIDELVQAGIEARSFVNAAVESHGVSTSPRALHCRRVLERLDVAIAEGQAQG